MYRTDNKRLRTVIICENCNNDTITPLYNVPLKCPHCKTESVFTVRTLSEDDAQRFKEFMLNKKD